MTGKPRSSKFSLTYVFKNAGQKKFEFREVKFWSENENLKTKSFILFKTKIIIKVFYSFAKILGLYHN